MRSSSSANMRELIEHAYVTRKVLEDDCVVKMNLYALNIWRDRFKEWDVIKFLAKVVEILEEVSIISSMYQY